MTTCNIDDLTLVNTPFRDRAGALQIYTISNHPLLPIPNTAFVVLQDLSKHGVRESLKHEKEGTIPQGSNEEVEELGWFRMRPGEFLFSRDKNGLGLAEDDVLQVLTRGREHFTEEEKQNLTRSRDECLGPREQRSPEAPVVSSAQIHVSGGLPIEQGRDVKCIKNTRAYTLANSTQPVKHRSAPAAGSKMQGGLTDNGRLRQNLLKASGAFSKKSMEAAPTEIQDQLRTHASLYNKPDLGLLGNYAYGTAQLNIAVAKCRDSGAGMKELGIFGGKHRDNGDHGAYFTNMLAHSDLPPGYDPGHFFIFGLGVYVVLDNFTCVNFSGLRMHGGQPPTAPLGEEPLDWAYRFVVISYPLEKMSSGDAHVVLAALPKDSTYDIFTEMIHVTTNPEARPFARCATWAEDGPVQYEEESHMNHIARHLITPIIYILNQLPPAYEVQFNTDKFLQSITTTIGGKRKPLDTWDFAPGWRDPDSQQTSEKADFPSLHNQNSVREGAIKSFAAYDRKMHYHIPYANSHLEEYSLVELDALRSTSDHTGGRLPLAPKRKAATVQRTDKKKPKRARKAQDDEEEYEPPGSTIMPDRKGKRHAQNTDSTQSNEQESEGRASVVDVDAGMPETNGEEEDACNEVYDDGREAYREAEDFGAPDRGQIEFSTFGNGLTTNKVKPLRTYSTGRGGQASRDVLALCSNPVVAAKDLHRGRQLRSATTETPETALARIQWTADVIADVTMPPSEVDIDYEDCVQVIPYMKGLDLKTIEEARGDLFSSTAALSSFHLELPHNNISHVDVVDTAFGTMLHSPFDERTFGRIQAMWSGFRALEASEAEMTLSLVFPRKMIMIQNYYAWYWLDVFCVDVAKKVLKGSVYAKSWITKLVHRIAVLLEESHVDVLNLGCTWYAYNHLRSAIFCNVKVNKRDITVFNDLRLALQLHPIKNPTSKERTCLSEMADLLADFEREGMQGISIRARIVEHKGMNQKRLLGFFVELEPVLRNMDIAHPTPLQAFVLSDIPNRLPHASA
ncbi:hypothetical protein Hypma_008134 [Hypsizygus marmoreus]|uniref:Uncharacterized protein n=1 Tax=Hypsizygus marmoreus TaxID=39966 RepID=A0A369K0K5_HYPMA|nr:hypothetical protein Hypma_008134 [Hypsizygus marmoreus]